MLLQLDAPLTTASHTDRSEASSSLPHEQCINYADEQNWALLVGAQPVAVVQDAMTADHQNCGIAQPPARHHDAMLSFDCEGLLREKCLFCDLFSPKGVIFKVLSVLLLT